MAIDRICVIGLGYIGLPTAAVLASRKFQVVGVDVQQNVVDTVNRGGIHIVEPDLDMVVNAAVNQGYLTASTDMPQADVFIITVPTPLLESNEPDVGYIRQASEALAPVLEQGNLVVLESTSPVGTTEQLCGWLAELRPDLTFPHTHADRSDIRVAHCPERVLPGRVLRELIQNDRIVGGMSRRCSHEAAALYATFVDGRCHLTDMRTAELTKLVENSYRDVNIAFANELSMISQDAGIDVNELIRLANRHPRVNILQPGPGVGGHCIAVDPWFIVHGAPERSHLIRTAREVNDAKPHYVAELISSAAEARATRRIACFGAAFKPDVDDMRESPAVEVIRELVQRGFEVRVIEPHASDLAGLAAELGCHAATLDEAAVPDTNTVLAVLVAHRQFRESEDLRALCPLDFCGCLPRGN